MIDGGERRPYPLVLVGVFELQVVGQGSHGDGQLADLLQLDGPLMGSHDERIHPPVCCLKVSQEFVPFNPLPNSAPVTSDTDYET